MTVAAVVSYLCFKSVWWCPCPVIRCESFYAEVISFDYCLYSSLSFFLSSYENVQILKNYSFINYYSHNIDFLHHVSCLKA